MFSKLMYHLDFNKFEARNMVLSVLGAAPATPVVGQSYYDSGVGAPRFYDGAAWGNKATDSALLNGQNGAYYLARGNATGTQTAATISDFASTVIAFRLDQFALPTAPVAMNGQRLTGLADPTSAQDAATMGYVQAQVSNAAAGIDSKPSVRLTTAGANDTLAGLAARDGVVPVAGDRILVPSQTTASQNGVYVAAAGAWARAADADTSAEITPGATWFVEEGGTYGASTWRCGNTGAITLGTTGLTITQLSASISYTAGNGILLTGSAFSVKVVASGGLTVAAGGVAVDRTLVPFKFAADIGNGALTAIPVVHNLNTTDVTVMVRDKATGEAIGCKCVVTDANTVTLSFGAAPAANSLRAVVTG